MTKGRHWLGSSSQIYVENVERGMYELVDIGSQQRVVFTLDDFPHLKNTALYTRNVEVFETKDGFVIETHFGVSVFLRPSELKDLQLYLS